MKKTIYLFIGLVVSIILADRIVYKVIHNCEKQVFTGEIAGKVNYFDKVKDSMDILVFGSSRALHHVDPSVFGPSTFNMGVDGKRLGYAAGLITTLKKKNQVILVHIDQEKIFERGYDGTDALSLLNKAQDDAHLMEYLKESFPKEVFVSKLFKCYSYNGKVFPIIKNYFMPSNDLQKDGFSPLYPTSKQTEIFKGIFEDRGGPIQRSLEKPHAVNPIVEQCINRTMAIGKANESKVIFFTSPSLFHIDEGLRMATQKFFQEKGVVYIDDVDFFKGIDFDLWLDDTHLAYKGAEIYSQHLKKEFDSIYSAGK